MLVPRRLPLSKFKGEEERRTGWNQGPSDPKCPHVLGFLPVASPEQLQPVRAKEQRPDGR